MAGQHRPHKQNFERLLYLQHLQALLSKAHGPLWAPRSAETTLNAGGAGR